MLTTRPSGKLVCVCRSETLVHTLGTRAQICALRRTCRPTARRSDFRNPIKPGLRRRNPPKSLASPPHTGGREGELRNDRNKFSFLPLFFTGLLLLLTLHPVFQQRKNRAEPAGGGRRAPLAIRKEGDLCCEARETRGADLTGLLVELCLRRTKR